MREKICFDDNWLFHEGDIKTERPRDKGPIYTSSKTERMLWGPASRNYKGAFDDFTRNIEYCTDAWRVVNLPHDYIISQVPSEKENNTLGYFKYVNAWYRKEFYLSENDRDKRLTLLFEGIATYATVYVNGCVLKHNFCGYNSFEVDISDFAKFGEDYENRNVIAVYVQNDEHEGWWYQGGGIYRHVWLNKTNKVAVDLWGVYAKPQRISDDEWSVDFETTLVNDTEDDIIANVVTYIKDKEQNTVAKTQTQISVPYMDKSVANSKTTVNSPILWDIDNPYQYTVVTEVWVSDKKCDEYEIKTGFRYFEMNAEKGMYLNGRHVKIKGLCMHQDFGITGKAVADNVLRYKVELMKEMGANGVRMSHYPHSDATMDALDEMGFIVMGETRWFSSSEESMEQLEMLIKRDRNRPSVFFWSIGNEEPFHIADEGRRITKKMKAFVKKLDSTRLVTSAVSDDPDISTVYDDLEVIGINYNMFNGKYDIVRAAYPDKPIFASECCATSSSRGWYDDDHEVAYYGAYDKDTTNWFCGREKNWQFVAEREWVAGSYQWIAFEHRGETVWPRLCSQSGAIDMFLQKKDAFYQNKSHWVDEPMVHLMPHWNFKGREGEEIKVFAYTNCDEAELYLNGKSQGICDTRNCTHGEWMVKYEEGTIRVEARIDGKTICTQERTTTGSAKKLMMKLDNSVTANGKDVAIISCYCVDENGNEVPDAQPTVFFNCNKLGRIIGTGSADTDHVPPHFNERKMYAGRITVAVQTGKDAGDLKVYAKCENLESAVLTIPIA